MCFIVILGRIIIAGNHSLKISYGTIAVNTGTNPTQRRQKLSILRSIKVHCEKTTLSFFCSFQSKTKNNDINHGGLQQQQNTQTIFHE